MLNLKREIFAASERTFRFAGMVVSFENGRTFRFADYKSEQKLLNKELNKFCTAIVKQVYMSQAYIME